MGYPSKIGSAAAIEALSKLPVVENMHSRGAKLRNKKNLNTTGLLRGDSGIREHRASKKARSEARLAERRITVDAMVVERAASLPPDMARSPIVLDSIRNLSRVQIILDGFLDQIDMDVDGKTGDSPVKAVTDLFAKVKSAHDDLLAKWPSQDEGRPVQQIPASVMDWIRAESAKPVVVN